MTTVNVRHASRSSRLLLTRVPNSGKHMAEPRRSIGADPGDLKGRAHPDRGSALLRRYRRRAAQRCDARARCGRRRVRPRERAGLARSAAGDHHRARCRREAGKPYEGAVALGCVIRGDTIHFEIVSFESSRGLMEISRTRGVPIGNGILTVDNDAQARMRAAWTRPTRAAMRRVPRSRWCGSSAA